MSGELDGTPNEKEWAGEPISARVKKDAALVAALDAVKPKKKSSRLKKVLNALHQEPTPILLARSYHLDDDGILQCFEITAPRPPERPVEAFTPVFHTKEYQVGTDKKTGEPIMATKTFGPTHSNRRQKRLLTRLVIKKMMKTKKKAA